MNEIEELILKAMLDNHLSVFEVTGVNSMQCTFELTDLIDKKTYTIMDMGFSQSVQKGLILFTRLLPIEDVYMTSGLLFVFTEDKRKHIQNVLQQEKSYRIRRKSPKIKAKKRDKKSLFEIMFHANKRWGSEYGSNRV